MTLTDEQKFRAQLALEYIVATSKRAPDVSDVLTALEVVDKVIREVCLLYPAPKPPPDPADVMQCDSCHTQVRSPGGLMRAGIKGAFSDEALTDHAPGCPWVARIKEGSSK